MDESERQLQWGSISRDSYAWWCVSLMQEHEFNIIAGKHKHTSIAQSGELLDSFLQSSHCLYKFLVYHSRVYLFRYEYIRSHFPTFLKSLAPFKIHHLSLAISKSLLLLGKKNNTFFLKKTLRLF